MLKELKMNNILTADVEDWFHGFSALQLGSAGLESRVTANTEKFLKLLSENNTQATFFVLGCVAEEYPRLVKSIADQGHEIATHGYRHRALFEQDEKTFSEDLKRSIVALENITNKKVIGFRAPEFSITARSLWAIDVLIKNGIKYDSSIVPVRHDRYGIPAAPRHPYRLERGNGRLIEFPPTTASFFGMNVLFCGGGWFRILPYALVERGLKNINRQGKRVLLYFHPWDLDPGQPRPNGLSPLAKFRRYWNIENTGNKIEKLLKTFKFIPIQAALGLEEYHTYQI